MTSKTRQSKRDQGEDSSRLGEKLVDRKDQATATKG